jgi:uncharacterized protein YegL
MSQFANFERPPVFPVCLVVDVSASMQGTPIAAVNQELPNLRQAILEDPTTGEIARIALVAFATRGRIVLPLSNMRESVIPQLEVENSTNFAEAFRTARQAIEGGIRDLGRGTRFYRPVVFFLSDGEHNEHEDWKPAWEQLTSREDKFGSEVVAFGMGQANRAVISAISTGNAFFAGDPDPATSVRMILRGIIGSIKTTSSSFSQPTGGALYIPPTDGLTRLPENVVW